MQKDNLAMAYESIQSYKMTAGGWEGEFVCRRFHFWQTYEEKENRQILLVLIILLLERKRRPNLPSVCLLCCGGLDGIYSHNLGPTYTSANF